MHKRVVLAAATLALAGFVVAGASAAAASGPPRLSDNDVQRLAGDDRFATSADAARQLWPDGGETVVLATGFDYPDALAGAAVAGASDAPLLLATTDELPAAVRQAIIDHDPQRVVLMGGEAVLSAELADEVRRLPGRPAVERLAGATRFATAATAAESLGDAADDDVAVATGFGFADALAAGSLAVGANPAPVVLASEGGVEADVSRFRRAVLIGHLSDQVERDAEAQTGATHALAGSSRWGTSRAVADHALTERRAGDGPLVLATGQHFADALSAGAIAARSNAPLLLIPTDGPTDAQARWISDHHRQLTGAWLVGGTSAVTTSAAHEIESLVAGEHGSDETITGTLDGDAELEEGCVWLDAGTERYEVLWPDGWEADTDPVELRNPDGDVVARRGDRVRVSGTRVDDVVTTCQVGPIFDAAEVDVE